MKISVIVPAHNEERYIAKCIESLLNQDVKADEIIIIDNNSSDSTPSIVKGYPVTLISEKKQGRTHAQIAGLNAAQYPIIARTDADTIVPRDWIKRIKEEFKDKDLIALSGPSHFYGVPDLVQVSNWHINTIYRSFRKILQHDCLYGPNMAVRKSAWEKVKNEVCMESNEVHEDVDLAIHLAPFGKIKFDSTIVVDASFRKWKYLQPYFDYPYRSLKVIRKHKQFVLEHKGRQIIKRVLNRARREMPLS